MEREASRLVTAYGTSEPYSTTSCLQEYQLMSPKNILNSLLLFRSISWQFLVPETICMKLYQLARRTRTLFCFAGLVCQPEWSKWHYCRLWKGNNQSSLVRRSRGTGPDSIGIRCKWNNCSWLENWKGLDG